MPIAVHLVIFQRVQRLPIWEQLNKAQMDLSVMCG
jgi:hypothetical protein